MNPIIDNLAYQTGMYCDGTPDSWDSEAINNFASAILQDVLNTVQEYGDQQHQFWQERIVGVDYEPAARHLINRIRDRYDVKDPVTPSTTD